MLNATNTKVLIAALAAAIALSGCHSQPPQTTVPAQQAAIKHDQEMRQQVQQQKKKSKAYPVNGSKTNSYVP